MARFLVQTYKAHVVAAAIRKTVNETIGEFEKSKSIVK